MGKTIIHSIFACLLVFQLYAQQESTPTLRATPKGGEAKQEETSKDDAYAALSRERYDGLVHVNFFLGFPREEFKENNTHVGVGLDGGLLLHTPGLPLLFGLNLSFSSYGTTKRKTPWSTTIPDVFVEVERNNNYLMIDLAGRIQPTMGFFSPYVEFAGGASNLYTSTKVIDPTTNETIAESQNLSDWTWNYWAGAGVELILSPGQVYQGELKGNTFGLHFGVRYHTGGEAEYLTPEDVQVEQGSVTYNVRKSRTSLLVFVLGISIRG